MRRFSATAIHDGFWTSIKNQPTAAYAAAGSHYYRGENVCRFRNDDRLSEPRYDIDARAWVLAERTHPKFLEGKRKNASKKQNRSVTAGRLVDVKH